MIQRDLYLNELVSLQGNDMIKVITGMRRCGKSYLLFDIFVSYLEEHGITPEQIIKIDLEDFKNRALRNPDNLYSYVESRIADDRMHYILLYEVQMLEHFEDVLNGFLKMRHVDVYVTGSNAKFLFKDIITEFRSRGIEKIVHGFKADGLTPPTFSVEQEGVTVHFPREKFVAINLGGTTNINQFKGSEKTDINRTGTGQKERIVELMKAVPMIMITRTELSKELGLHESSVQRRLNALVKEGRIRRVGPDKGDMGGIDQ